MSRDWIAVALTAWVLSGCQSTGVVTMDNDSYFTGKNDGVPGLGVNSPGYSGDSRF